MRTWTLLFLISVMCPGQGVCTWGPLGSGANDLVRALVEHDDGTGGALYAAGSFQQMGGVSASRISRWNGTSWSPVGPGAGGVTVGTFVFDLTVYDDGGGPHLYAGGAFSAMGGAPAEGVARWDGANWTGLGGGLGPALGAQVLSMTVWDDGAGPALYVAGIFSSAGGVPAANIARWDGSSWSALGSGVTAGPGGSPFVMSLAVHDDGTGSALYAAGGFTAAGGVAANNVARWDGANWFPVGGGLGTGPSDQVRSLASYDDGFGSRLHAAIAFFPQPPGIPAGQVSRWDGANWAPIGATTLSASTFPPVPRVLTVVDDGTGPAMFLGGQFDHVSGVPANALARWDGTTWSAVGSGVQWSLIANPSLVDSIAVSSVGTGPGMFLGGNFDTAGGLPSIRVARRQCTGPPTLVLRQPGGAGTQVLIQNQFTMPGNEYLNLYSLSLCPGGVGTGPFFGLCAPTLLHRQFLLSQALLPLGTPAFHFAAGGRSARWGPFALPPLTLDAVTLDITGGSVGQVSAVSRFTVQ